MLGLGWVAHLIADEQRHRLHRVVPAVDVVPHEEVVHVGDRAADPEDLHEVMELRVDIAADDDGRMDLLHVGLSREHLAGLRSKT